MAATCGQCRTSSAPVGRALDARLFASLEPPYYPRLMAMRRATRLPAVLMRSRRGPALRSASSRATSRARSARLSANPAPKVRKTLTNAAPIRLQLLRTPTSAPARTLNLDSGARTPPGDGALVRIRPAHLLSARPEPARCRGPATATCSSSRQSTRTRSASCQTCSH